MTIADIKKTTESKMAQSIEAFRQNLAKIRTGRATPTLLDSVMVDYYDNMTPLSQVANVSVLDSRTLSVQPWEKGMGPKIEKAIRESDLVKNEGENAKIAIRNLRRDANEMVKKLVKDKLASEDDQKRAEAETQKITDKNIAEVDKMVVAKEQELMAV